jgi:hypothetical protein
MKKFSLDILKFIWKFTSLVGNILSLLMGQQTSNSGVFVKVETQNTLSHDLWHLVQKLI